MSQPEPVLLTLLFTNDMHGRVLPPSPESREGLACLAPLVRWIRDEMPNVVLLDAGDIAHGTPEEKYFAGKPLLAAMNALGYEAATVGNHEFDFGLPRLREAIAFAGFPYLSANVVDADGEPWGGLLPYTILQKGGLRIGVFGLTTPTTVDIEWPRTLEGVRFTDPVEMAQKIVLRLRKKERVDVVVFLSHLGFPADRELAAAIPGIDVILGGHTHTVVAEQVWIGETLIAQAGCFGRALGRVDLLVRSASDQMAGQVVAINGQHGQWWGRDGVSAPEGRAFPDTPLLPPDPDIMDSAVVEAYHPYREKIQPYLGEVLTTANEDLSAAGATVRETALGNLLADAVRAQTGADIAFAASGQIVPNGRIAAGPVRVADLYALLAAYTRQHIVQARVSGSLLSETLFALAAEPGRLPLHLSGAIVRPNSIIIGEQPLDAERSYIVAAAAHVIQDHFYGRAGIEILEDDALAPTIRDCTIAFLRGHLPLTAALDRRWQTT